MRTRYPDTFPTTERYVVRFGGGLACSRPRRLVVPVLDNLGF
jgi:hypothetical protein